MSQPKRSVPPKRDESSHETIAERPAAGVTTADPNSVPVPLKVVADRIPVALRKLNRWVLWRYVLKHGKWTKVPHSAKDGHMADATNHANGAPFDKAWRAYLSHPARWSGVGFMLGEGIGGVDVDDCRDPVTGMLNERGQKLSQRFAATYAEVSPSGTGFKVLVDLTDDASLYSVSISKDGLELYGGKRYFTITGVLLPGHAKGVARLRDEFKALAEEHGGVRPVAKAVERDDGDVPPRLGLTLADIGAVFDHLPFVWIDDYNHWLNGGMAVHHETGGSPEGLALWDERSSRNPNPDKYQPGCCADKWNTFGKPGRNGKWIIMRTLIRAAEATGWRAPDTIASAIFDFGDWLDKANINRFDLNNVPPMEWMFEGISPYGKVTVMAGAGGSSKSFLALSLAVHWAARKVFGAFRPMRGDADEALVLFAEEDEGDIHRRVAATIGAAGLTPEEHALVFDGRLMVRSMLDLENVALAKYDPERGVVDGRLLRDLRRALEKRPTIRWIVLDPLALLHQLGENDNGAMAQLLRLLGRVAREFNVAIWVVHHLSKAGALADDLNNQAIRGASAIVDNARAAILLQRLTASDAAVVQATPDEARRMVRLTFGKNSHGDPLDACYVRIRDDGSVEPLAVQPMPMPAGVARAMRNLSSREQAADHIEASTMLATLLLLQRGPMGTNAIYKAKPAGRSRKVVQPALDRAVEDGLLSIADGPRASKVYTLTEAGRMHIDGEAL